MPMWSRESGAAGVGDAGGLCVCVLVDARTNFSYTVESKEVSKRCQKTKAREQPKRSGRGGADRRQAGGKRRGNAEFIKCLTE